MPNIIRTGGGSGGLKYNIFCQPTLPNDKFDGVCMLTPEKHPVKNIISKTSFIIGNTVDPSRVLPTFPGSINDIGWEFLRNLNLVYLMDVYAGVVSGGRYHVNSLLYSYNISTNTYQSLTTHRTPTDFGYYKGLTQQLYYRNSILKQCLFALSDTTCYFEIAENTLADSNNCVETTMPAPADLASATYIRPLFSDTNSSKAYFSATNWTTKIATFYSVDFETKTLTVIGQVPCTLEYLHGQVYNGHIYYYVSNNNTFTNALNDYNIALGTITTHTASFNFQNSGSRVYSTQAGGSIFFSSQLDSPRTWFVFRYAPDTGVFEKLPPEPEQYGFFSFDSKLCLMYGKKTYNLTSETLAENTLAIQDGSAYSYKVISTDKINAIYATLKNVWWYDTDFKEYPTYIGDGTAWLKIKN